MHIKVLIVQILKSKWYMNSLTHAKIRLSVHLQDDPYRRFHPSRLAQALQRTENRDTTLTAWFKLNVAHSSATEPFYHEMPELYVFQEKRRMTKL
jgi:hypothetical protein